MNEVEQLRVIQLTMLQAATISKRSADLYERTHTFKLRWYHWLYDTELKHYETEYLSGFKIFQDTLKQTQAKYRLIGDSEVLKTAMHSNLAMLSVSGHLYAETGNLLKNARHHSTIKFALAINIFAMSIALILLVKASF